jgi:hypothetical protein
MGGEGGRMMMMMTVMLLFMIIEVLQRQFFGLVLCML